MRYATQSPRFMTAKFDSTCAETGKPLKKGDTILYDPNIRKAYHNESQAARDWRSAEFDRTALGYEY